MSNSHAPRQIPVTIRQARQAICVPNLGEGRGAFQLFVEGDALFDAMLAAIEGATETIWMESYIFAADEVGARFVALLAAKARTGLDVRLHLDAFGAGQRNFDKFRRELERSGVRFRWFRPFDLRHPLRYFQRNHRKLLIVDGREAFLGGFNIRRLNSRRLHGETRQRDTHVRVPAPLATLAESHFDRLWQDARPLPANAIPEEADASEGLLVPSYSRKCQKRLACLHAGLIGMAQTCVYLTSPYFGPGTVVDRALQDAARRGVDVRLLVPRTSDPMVAGWATRAAYAQLLSAGVRVYEYLPRPLHAKTSVVDTGWSIIGSANLDYRSLFVNQELVLVAHDRVLAGQLQAQYLQDLSDAREVTLRAWHSRSWRARGFEVIGWAARRLL
ncbi:phosphatidylserine/phosphatidylglycerophosphate/cardiolipin synthase family protein [Pseudooceanicola sp.]|uniref:phospholipase D-like domain-containing protein n=2 Tax=Alphaproteobacteria TaxID=28211 RepID=UPI00262C8B08|nr:phosphatidylserine/phosphatidylglycerophosphate/cardiolipin synthase family protein [Pseudooceanicola sp.]MDF1856367.1 phosphatidylserine/phosphatidylglycerophosphate/cardiolipin synthase family protein [Pseudooceanicola sp.]